MKAITLEKEAEDCHIKIVFERMRGKSPSEPISNSDISFSCLYNLYLFQSGDSAYDRKNDTKKIKRFCYSLKDILLMHRL